MKIELDVFDRRMLSLIAIQEPILIADCLQFVEGPVWDSEGHRFLFNSIPESNTYSWSESTGLKLAYENGTKSNGMFLTKDRRLIVCEHATSSVVSRCIDGTCRHVLADYDGDIELNAPNDVVVSSRGLIYFTDPVFGRLPKPSSVVRPIPSDRRAVYMIDGEHNLHMVASGYINPNGLAFSPDEKVLYVNDSDDYLINAYRVADDGMLFDEILFARIYGGEENHSPDGLKIDEFGNVYCVCQNAGIYIFDPSGAALGIIRIPNVRVVNVCWGGEDGLSLFMTCDTKVYMLRMKVRSCLQI